MSVKHSLAYAVRRTESVENEAILLRAQAIHPKVAMIAFNLACYAIELDKNIRRLAINDEDLKSVWDWIGGLK